MVQSGTMRRVVAGGVASGEWVVAVTLPASLEVLEIPDILEVLEVLENPDYPRGRASLKTNRRAGIS